MIVKTISVREQDVQRDWYVIDAQGQTLGRLATQVATLLRGKHKPQFTPHVDCGDYVIVVNAEKIHVTGNKMSQKIYYRHSGYPGGVKTASYREIMEKKPEFAIHNAVKGMLPKNRLGRKLIKKLKVYTGESHPHSAQKPETLSF